MLIEPSRRATTVLTAFKVLVVAALVALILTAHSRVPATQEAPRARSVAVDSWSPGLHRLLVRHRCSTTGFEDGAEPAEALVRRTDGTLRIVAFEQGWAVFTRDAPGTLIAVCLGRDRRAQL